MRVSKHDVIDSAVSLIKILNKKNLRSYGALDELINSKSRVITDDNVRVELNSYDPKTCAYHLAFLGHDGAPHVEIITSPALQEAHIYLRCEENPNLSYNSPESDGDGNMIWSKHLNHSNLDGLIRELGVLADSKK